MCVCVCVCVHACMHACLYVCILSVLTIKHGVYLRPSEQCLENIDTNFLFFFYLFCGQFYLFFTGVGVLMRYCILLNVKRGHIKTEK